MWLPDELERAFSEEDSKEAQRALALFPPHARSPAKPARLLMLSLVELLCSSKNLTHDQSFPLLLRLSTANRVLLNETLSEALWLKANEYAQLHKEQEKQELQHLVKNLVAGNPPVLEEQPVLLQLDEETLVQCALVSAVFQKKRVRVNTKLIYEQQKFNLMREENEGFAKLIYELSQPGITDATVDLVIENVKSLIGYFSLDPIRVLDLALDAFEADVHNLAYLKLIRLFKPSALPQIVGFKFQNFRGAESPPRSLFRLAAQLLKHDLLALPDLWPHLQAAAPDAPDEIEALMRERLRRAEVVFKSNHVVRLGNRSMAEGDKEREKERREVDELSREETSTTHNRKLLLLESLVRLNAWKVVEHLFFFLIHRHPLIGDQECPRPQTSDKQNLTVTPEKIKCKCRGTPS